MDPEMIKFIELFDNPFYSFTFTLLAIWSLAWKGVALWKAAHNNQKWWFIAMLILNTVGIVEIIYIFYFGKREKKKEDEVKLQ